METVQVQKTETETENEPPVIQIGDFVYLRDADVRDGCWHSGMVRDMIGNYIFLDYGTFKHIAVKGLRIPEKADEVVEIWRADAKGGKTYVWKKEQNWCKSTRYALLF